MSGDYTFQGSTGRRVPDYIIIYDSLFDYVLDFKVLACDISETLQISCFINSKTVINETKDDDSVTDKSMGRILLE